MATIFQLQNMKRKCQQWELTDFEMEGTVDKCLAFCQALVSSNQKFTFTLSIGKETFKFDNKELVTSSCVTKKKKSPSQIRREDRRREARKSKITEEVVEIPPVTTPQNHKATEKTAVPKQKSTALTFKCEQCDYTSTSEKGLKQHARMKHRISQVERTCTCSNLNCCGCYHEDSCECRQTNKITDFCDCDDVNPTHVDCNKQPKTK